jgi:tripartite-type tricarboxylate transporter receptor subunit TctC
VVKLAQIVKSALARSDVQERLSGLGIEVVGNSPEEFTQFIKSEEDRWAEVAKANNITVE